MVILFHKVNTLPQEKLASSLSTHAFLGSAYLPESTKPFHVLVNKLISTLHV